MKCPVCGEEGTLIVEKDAIIMFGIENDEIVDRYSSENISFLDTALITCVACEADSNDNWELEEVLNFLLDIESEEEVSHDVPRKLDGSNNG